MVPVTPAERVRPLPSADRDTPVWQNFSEPARVLSVPAAAPSFASSCMPRMEAWIVQVLSPVRNVVGSTVCAVNEK
jgi:hypothetical protein